MSDWYAGVFQRNVPIIGIGEVVFVVTGAKIVVDAPCLSVECLGILSAQSNSKVGSLGVKHNASGMNRLLLSKNGLLLDEVVERRYDFSARRGSVDFSTPLNAEIQGKILNAIPIKGDVGLVDVVG